MGDSSQSVLSPTQAKKLGREFMGELRRAGLLYDDVELSEYINHLGSKLVSNGPTPAEQFTFFIVNNSAINAFAVPGGYIGIHSGLIKATESEAELSSVLAHEIAHITQHHITRRYAKTSSSQLPLTAALIAAILLGGQNPEITEAAIATAVAGSQQLAIDYTRAHEKEADRVGIDILARSGYSPEAMASFFEKLADANRFAGRAPEFLSTHPVTQSRIADARHRASTLPVSRGADSSTPTYPFVKARLSAEDTERPADTLKLVEESATTRPQVLHHYMRAHLLIRLNRTEESLKAINKSRDAAPLNISVINAAGRLHRKAKEYQTAVDIYQDGLESYPDNRVLVLELAETYRSLGDYRALKQLLNGRTLTQLNSATAFELLAEAEAELGNKAASHLAQAEYHYLRHQYSAAIDQASAALRSDGEFYNAARAEALLNELINKTKMEEKAQ